MHIHSVASEYGHVLEGLAAKLDYIGETGPLVFAERVEDWKTVSTMLISRLCHGIAFQGL
eukprot:5472852-Amphidinium_carterae.2